MYEYRARVVKIIDGDTIDLDVDLGFNITIRVRGRLMDVDTPERGHEDWKLATQTLNELIASERDANGYVAIMTTKTGKYCRWLVKVGNINKTLAEKWPYRTAGDEKRS